MGSAQLYPILTAPYRFDNSYGWVGISHCGIFDDGAGNWFYTSQGRFPVNVGGNEYSNAIMMGHVRSIRWDATAASRYARTLRSRSASAYHGK